MQTRKVGKMSYDINSVASNGEIYRNNQAASSSSSSVSSKEDSGFGNLLAKAISRCFADSIAKYEKKQEAAAQKNTVAASSGSSVNFQMSESMDAIFQEASNTYGVPVNLLKAVGMAESNFNQYAQSGAGAQGVMQLMPATAASLGVTNSFDVRQNIMGGAKLLAQNLSMYGGNVDLALAAYNAGPGNVAAYGGIPPFAETQNYSLHKRICCRPVYFIEEVDAVGECTFVQTDILTEIGVAVLFVYTECSAERTVFHHRNLDVAVD